MQNMGERFDLKNDEDKFTPLSFHTIIQGIPGMKERVGMFPKNV